MKKKLLCISLAMVMALSFIPTTAMTTDQKIDEISRLSEYANPNDDRHAKYVFFFIGDGMGSAQRMLAEYYNKEVNGNNSKLVMNRFSTSSVYTTHAQDTLITDSAASGTAMSACIKTMNGVIAQTPSGKKAMTIAEAAKQNGMAIGIATTTRITHATPASFISHNKSRGNENEIAVDYLDSDVDYLVGGGIRHFIPQNAEKTKDPAGNTIKSKRKDDRNVLNEFADLGYIVDQGTKGVENFRKYQPKLGDKYVGLFTYSHLPYTIDDPEAKVPTAAEITKKGIELLSQNEKGFFFMFEGGRVDHACHANDPASAVMDTLALDDAVKEAVEFYFKHPEDTIILVGADHECGGLGLGKNTDYFLNLEELSKVNASVEDKFEFPQDGTLDDAIATAQSHFGLTDLNEREIEEIKAAIKLNSKGEYRRENKYKYNEVGQALTHIVCDRTSLYFTSNAHTADTVPLSVVGLRSREFDGFIDNTDIPKRLSKIMGIQIVSVYKEKETAIIPPIPDLFKLTANKSGCSCYECVDIHRN